MRFRPECSVTPSRSRRCGSSSICARHSRYGSAMHNRAAVTGAGLRWRNADSLARRPGCARARRQRRLPGRPRPSRPPWRCLRCPERRSPRPQPRVVRRRSNSAPYAGGAPGGRVLNRRCTHRYCSGLRSICVSSTAFSRAASAASSPPGKSSSAGPDHHLPARIVRNPIRRERDDPGAARAREPQR